MKTGTISFPELFRRLETVVVSAVLLLIALIPTTEILARKFFTSGIHGSAEYIQHLIVWLTFLGGMIAVREKKHLTITVGIDHLPPSVRTIILQVVSFLSVAITASFAWFSYEFVRNGFDGASRIGVLPLVAVMAIVPIGFTLMALRFAAQAPCGRWGVGLSLLGIALPLVLSFQPNIVASLPLLPLVIVLIGLGLLGTPLFVVLGGLATVFILKADGVTAVLVNEAYTMLTGPSIPSIPLFTLAGFILSESKAGERLVGLFRALLGWMPGGLAVVTTLVCAFFTTFTGASGVTILALGGILSYALVQSGHKRSFSLGLLTASGSLGLLFAPSLPLILYGVIARIDIRKMFVAGVIPGAILVASVAAFGVLHSLRNKSERTAFSMPALFRALRDSVWELCLPILIVVSFFSGFATLVETGAIAVVYTLLVQVGVKRDIKLRQLPKVIGTGVPVMGGVLMILAIANGLSYVIVDAEIPANLAHWCAEHIHSKYLFLLLLNVALLVVGCLMDVFSAIMVVAPLIIPLGEAFGVDPVHLGIIFLANLELGYLTPPVGLNLFLASYRFEEPLTRIYRMVLPFLAILLVTVLLITYVPWLSTALLDIIRF